MSSPDWKTVTALGGATRVSTLQHDDGSVSIRLTQGAVSIAAAVSREGAAFLSLRHEPELARAS